MKQFIFCIPVVLTLFFSNLTVLADDVNYFDIWYSNYEENNPDYSNDFTAFATDIMTYQGIIINPNNKDSFVSLFSSYVVSNVPSGSSYLSSIQSGVNAYNNGLISSNGFISFLKSCCEYGDINYQQIIKDTSKDVNNDKGYSLVPAFPLSSLSTVYAPSFEIDFLRGGCSQSVLTNIMTNEVESTSYASNYFYTDDLKDFNFVFNDSQYYTPNNFNYFQTLYNVFVSKNVDNMWQYGRFSPPDMGYTTLNGVNASFNRYYLYGGSYFVNHISYGSWVVNGGGAVGNSMLIYTNTDYAFVPFFYSQNSLNSYLTGQLPFYTNDLLKNLEINDEFDYSRLQKIVFDAIQNGDFLTANELQSIINGSVTNYLTQININTKDILLSIQLGLIDNLNNEPYLKQIRDLQIISNQKFDQLIEMLQNMSFGGSGSSDLSSITSRLDTIISILGVPDVDIDVDTPEISDFKDLLVSKFPFSIPYDVYILVSLIGVEPEKPELELFFPIMGQDQAIPFNIDLTWFDEFRPYWYGFCDIAFLIILLIISLKIVEGVKD